MALIARHNAQGAAEAARVAKEAARLKMLGPKDDLRAAREEASAAAAVARSKAGAAREYAKTGKEAQLADAARVEAAAARQFAAEKMLAARAAEQAYSASLPAIREAADAARLQARVEAARARVMAARAKVEVAGSIEAAEAKDARERLLHARQEAAVARGSVAVAATAAKAANQPRQEAARAARLAASAATNEARALQLAAAPAVEAAAAARAVAKAARTKAAAYRLGAEAHVASMVAAGADPEVARRVVNQQVNVLANRARARAAEAAQLAFQAAPAVQRADEAKARAATARSGSGAAAAAARLEAEQLAAGVAAARDKANAARSRAAALQVEASQAAAFAQNAAANNPAVRAAASAKRASMAANQEAARRELALRQAQEVLAANVRGPQQAAEEARKVAATAGANARALAEAARAEGRDGPAAFAAQQAAALARAAQQRADALAAQVKADQDLAQLAVRGAQEKAALARAEASRLGAEAAARKSEAAQAALVANKDAVAKADAARKAGDVHKAAVKTAQDRERDAAKASADAKRLVEAENRAKRVEATKRITSGFADAARQFASQLPSFGGGGRTQSRQAAPQFTIADAGQAVQDFRSNAGIAALAGQVRDFAGGMIVANQTMEDFRLAVDTLAGSAAKGGKLFEDLKKFAVSTPYDLKDLMRTSQHILGLGFAAESVIPILHRLGDVSALMGGGGSAGERLDRVAHAMGVIQAQGKATLQNLRPFFSQGIPILDALATKLGVTKQQLTSMIKAGQVSAPTALNAIMSIGEDPRFKGGMAKLSATFSGMLSNLRDLIFQRTADIGKPIFDAFKEGLQQLMASVQGPLGQQVIAGFTSLMTRVAAAVRPMMPTLIALTPVVLAVGGALGVMGVVLPAVVTGFGMLTSTAGLLLSPFRMVAGVLGGIGGAVTGVLGSAVGVVKGVLGSLLGVVGNAGGVILALFTNPAMAVKPLIGVFTSLFAAITNPIGFVVGGFRSILGVVTAVINPVYVLAAAAAFLGFTLFRALNDPTYGGPIREALTSILETAKYVAQGVVAAFGSASGMGSMLDSFSAGWVSVFKGVAGWLAANKNTLREWAYTATTAAMGAFKSIGAGLQSLWGWMTSNGAGFAEAWNWIWSAVTVGGRVAFQLVGAGLKEMVRLWNENKGAAGGLWEAVKVYAMVAASVIVGAAKATAAVFGWLARTVAWFFASPAEEAKKSATSITTNISNAFDTISAALNNPSLAFELFWINAKIETERGVGFIKNKMLSLGWWFGQVWSKFPFTQSGSRGDLVGYMGNVIADFETSKSLNPLLDQQKELQTRLDKAIEEAKEARKKALDAIQNPPAGPNKPPQKGPDLKAPALPDFGSEAPAAMKVAFSGFAEMWKKTQESLGQNQMVDYARRSATANERTANGVDALLGRPPVAAGGGIGA